MTWTRIGQLRIQLMVAVAVILALIWGAVAYQLGSVRDGALRTATQQGQNLANVVAGHFSSHAETIDRWLRRLTIQWARDPKRFPDAVEFEKALRKDTFVSQVSVVDARGWLAYSDLGGPKERIYFGDREYFKIQSNSGEDRLYISGPAKERSSGKLSIHFTRPILDSGGKFAGLLVLSVSPDALTRAYEALELGPNGFVSVRRLDNSLLLRWPGMGEDGNGRPLQPIPSRILAAGMGSEIRPGGLDGIERIFNFRRIADLPLYASVGQPLESVLAEYYEERRLYVAAGGVGSFLVLWFGLLVLAKLKREERVEGELSRSEERFRSLTELSADWYWEQDAELRFVATEGATDERGGITPEAHVGKYRWELPNTEIVNQTWDKHKSVLEARQPFHDLILRRLGAGGETHYVSVSGRPIFGEQGSFCGYRGVARDITETRRAQESLRLEHTINRCLATADSVSTALKASLRAVCETEGWECGRYLRADEQAGLLRFYESWSVPGPELERYIDDSRRMVYGRGVGLVGEVWQSGTPQWVPDMTQDPRVIRKALVGEVGMRGGFVVPVTAEGKTIGVMVFQSREIREPDERLLKAMYVIGTQIGQFMQRKQAEEVVRESETHYRALTELSADWYWEQDAQFRFTQISGHMGEKKQFPRELWLGKTRWELPYVGMSEDGWRAHKGALEAHRPFRDFVVASQRKDGSLQHISTSGYPIFDGAGKFNGYRGIARDVSERKRAEELLRLEHTVTRSLAEAETAAAAVQAAIRAVCETEGWECGRYLRVDERAGVLRCVEAWGIQTEAIERFLTLSRSVTYAPGAGLAGRVWQSNQPLWLADVGKDPRAAQASLIREIGLHGAIFFPVMAEGKTIGVLAFNSREVREPEDRLMQAIGVIGSQIGQFLQRKQREEELLRFRTAMDVSEDMIWLIDPVRMSIIDVNDTACRKLGYSREELLSIDPQDIISMSRDELSRTYDRLIQGGDGDTAVGGWYRRKDGSRFPVEAFRRSVQSEGSHVIVAVVRDITERRAAEEELRRFRLAMDNSADMIVLIDRATMRFVDVNETACRLLGYSREELLGMGPQNVLPVAREDLERNYDSLIASPSADTSEILTGMKSHYICKDGSLLPFESTRHVLRSADTHIIAAISRDIRARLAIEEKLAYMAQFDALTGLPNRNLFQDRLTQAMALAKRNGWPMAVLFIDLDRFKLVNDTLGHGAGDKLLREAAKRLGSCIRSSDTVGRLGGDEFAAILSELGKPGDAGLVAQKIVDVFKRPFDLEGKETYVTASVGVTLYPVDSDSAEALVVNADAAMYRAKEQGRNNYQYFTRDMNERAIQRVQMEAALRRALEREEFRLFYQPKVDLVTGKICGFEALLRWQHPDKGMILPGDFIPMLEETGLIVQAGEWVLRTVCAQIKAWQKTALKVPPISVNLSARQFEQKNLKGTVGQILRDTKIDPSLIEFEITESLLMNDPEGAARTLDSLKEFGVRLSMDDFGTGYSSLGYLKRFPIDTLKIDRTFVRDISTDADDATLTRAIINLAQNLRLKVIAEGVETEDQLAFLRTNGCDEMQGYLFAKPAGAEECELMLREGRKLEFPRPGRKDKSGARRAHA